VANIHELFNALKEVERSGKTFIEFMEESSLSQAQDNITNSDSVKIMTVHAAKGLEFPVVFIAGLEDGIFPSGRSFEDVEQAEEERRLFYVAITRAKEKVFMSLARKRSSSSELDIKTGQLVKHKIFGKGVVISVNGNKATVLFENFGQKTILKDFLSGSSGISPIRDLLNLSKFSDSSVIYIFFTPVPLKRMFSLWRNSAIASEESTILRCG